MRAAQVFGSSPTIFASPYQQTVSSRVSKTARPRAPGVEIAWRSASEDPLFLQFLHHHFDNCVDGFRR